MTYPLACDCGAVRIEVPHLPKAAYACPCGWCRANGAAWGYYTLSELTLSGGTQTYRRARRNILFHRCTTCGCLTHWTYPPEDMAGVNFAFGDPKEIGVVPVTDTDPED